MHQGQILQVGPPADVLRRPNSAFVARFVGAQNVFPVQSLDRANGTVVVGDGLRLDTPNLPEGADLLVMIRPEEIGLSPSGEGLPCRLQRVEDRGRHMRLHLQGPLPLLAIMTPQSFRLTGVAEGDDVVAHWRPEAVHVMAR